MNISRFLSPECFYELNFRRAFFCFDVPSRLSRMNLSDQSSTSKIMTATSDENEKDLEKLFKMIHQVKFAMLTTINHDGTLHSR